MSWNHYILKKNCTFIFLLYFQLFYFILITCFIKKIFLIGFALFQRNALKKVILIGFASFQRNAPILILQTPLQYGVFRFLSFILYLQFLLKFGVFKDSSETVLWKVAFVSVNLLHIICHVSLSQFQERPFKFLTQKVQEALKIWCKSTTSRAIWAIILVVVCLSFTWSQQVHYFSFFLINICSTYFLVYRLFPAVTFDF